MKEKGLLVDEDDVLERQVKLNLRMSTSSLLRSFEQERSKQDLASGEWAIQSHCVASNVLQQIFRSAMFAIAFAHFGQAQLKTYSARQQYLTFLEARTYAILGCGYHNTLFVRV